jgi:hypothetical protein
MKLPDGSTLPPGPCLSTTSQAQMINLAQNGYIPLMHVHTHPKHGYFQAPTSDCYDFDAHHNPPFVVRTPESDGTLHLPFGPSQTDTRDWKKGDNSNLFPGYVMEPGKIYRWDATIENGFKFKQMEFKMQSCVGGAE